MRNLFLAGPHPALPNEKDPPTDNPSTRSVLDPTGTA